MLTESFQNFYQVGILGAKVKGFYFDHFYMKNINQVLIIPGYQSRFQAAYSQF